MSVKITKKNMTNYDNLFFQNRNGTKITLKIKYKQRFKKLSKIKGVLL